MNTLTIGEVMTRRPKTIGLAADLDEAKRLMYQHEFRHLPVIDGAKMVGIISDRDIKLACAISEAPEKLQVQDAYTPSPFVVSEDTPLAKVVREMGERRIGSVLVSSAGKLAGIFTSTDACLCLAEHLADCAIGR